MKRRSDGAVGVGMTKAKWPLGTAFSELHAALDARDEMERVAFQRRQTFTPRPVYHHELPSLLAAVKPHGCICPVGAEATCKGMTCPRRAP